jgi:hypothetical protein
MYVCAQPRGLAQIALTVTGDRPEPLLATARVLPGDERDGGGEIPAAVASMWVAMLAFCRPINSMFISRCARSLAAAIARI